MANPMQSIGKAIRTGTLTGGHSKATYKSASGKARYELINPARARKSARQRQGRAIARGAYDTWINPTDARAGANLKAGIEGISVRAGLTEDDGIFQKIEKMNPDKLADMYSKNELIFDVAFNYHGADSDTDMDTKKGMAVIPGKKKDLEFLIESYEKAYGPL